MAQRIPEGQRILLDQIRLVVQAAAIFLSMGQGNELARCCMNAEITIMTPLILKTQTLYCENQINCGKVETNPAITAPNPKATKRLGSAQQINVPVEANSENQE